MSERTQKLIGDTVVVRNEGLLTTEVHGELVAMSVEHGMCYGLNGVGTRIWALIAAPRSINSLCRELLREYDVEEEVCRREVVDLLKDLRSERIVTVGVP